QVEKGAEGVHLDKPAESGAAEGARIECCHGAQAAAEDGEEGQDGAAAREGLEEHDEGAEGAPDGFWEYAEEVFRAGDHGRPGLSGEMAIGSCGANASGRREISRCAGRPLRKSEAGGRSRPAPLEMTGGAMVMTGGAVVATLCGAGKGGLTGAKAGEVARLAAPLTLCPDA